MTQTTIDLFSELHISLDIETLGLTPGCPVIAIGAVVIGNSIDNFYLSINTNQHFYDLHPDPDTLEWWHEPAQAAAFAKTFNGIINLEDALVSFRDWVLELADTSNQEIYIWAKSPEFDCSILKEAFARCNLEAPWSFRNQRDVRTLRHLVGGESIEFEGTRHYALDDAQHQADQVIADLSELGLIA